MSCQYTRPAFVCKDCCCYFCEKSIFITPSQALQKDFKKDNICAYSARVCGPNCKIPKTYCQMNKDEEES